jgi:hypothetical protein
MNIAPRGVILLTRAQSYKRGARRHNFFVYRVLTELLVKAWYKTNNCTRKPRPQYEIARTDASICEPKRRLPLRHSLGAPLFINPFFSYIACATNFKQRPAT